MNTPPQTQSDEILAAINRGVQRYFDDCRAEVQPFIKLNFRYPGCWHTNKSAWGWDLLRAPVNLFWAPFYELAMVLGQLFKKLGIKGLGNLLVQTPSGLTTSVQKHIAWLLHNELLKRPFDKNTIDHLDQCVVEELDKLAGPDVDHRALIAELEPVINDALNQYAITRTASADITNSLVSTLAGAFAFQKFTPGGFAIGFSIAAVISVEWSKQNFIFGDFLGGLYYSLFPPEPTLGTTLLSIAGVLFALAVFASLSGLITDPIQSGLGIHKRRLNKMINQLEYDFLRKQVGGFRPKDQYLARILEILDAAKVQIL